MPQYHIEEVDGSDPHIAYTINKMNAISFPRYPLEERHLDNGFWFFSYVDNDPDPVGFAGMVTFEPCDETVYFKRCFIVPEHRGKGDLQLRFLALREWKARELKYKRIVTDCAIINTYSARNLRRNGFALCDPEQRWAESQEPSLYWVKSLVA